VIDTKIQPGQIYHIREDGKWELYLDATMIGTFGVCPQMFKYSFIDNLAPKGDRPLCRELGSWWSDLMEVIYTNHAKGTTVPTADIPRIALELWVKLNMDEMEKLSPKQYKEFGGRYGALAMIADYATRQLPIDYATWKIVAAEASFGRNKEVCIGETDQIILYWMGQPDLFVIQNDRLLPVDHKSKSYLDAWTAKGYKPHIQIPGYIIAGQVLCESLGYTLQVDRAIINCVARSDRTDKSGESKHPRFKRITVSYNAGELAEWKRRRLRQAELIRYSIEHDNWTWNEYSCNSFFYRRCPYQNIDEKTPEVRPVIIAADYIKRRPWIPGLTEKEMEKKGEPE
jgi:hypothetical protein